MEVAAETYGPTNTPPVQMGTYDTSMQRAQSRIRESAYISILQYSTLLITPLYITSIDLDSGSLSTLDGGGRELVPAWVELNI